MLTIKHYQYFMPESKIWASSWYSGDTRGEKIYFMVWCLFYISGALKKHFLAQKLKAYYRSDDSYFLCAGEKIENVQWEMTSWSHLAS